jgi:hypothetical protein
MSASEILLAESVGCFLTHLLDSTHPTEISGSAFCARSALKRYSRRSFSSSVRSSALRGLKGLGPKDVKASLSQPQPSESSSRSLCLQDVRIGHERKEEQGDTDGGNTLDDTAGDEKQVSVEALARKARKRRRGHVQEPSLRDTPSRLVSEKDRRKTSGQKKKKKKKKGQREQ